jgi:hypothetical protein
VVVRRAQGIVHRGYPRWVPAAVLAILAIPATNLTLFDGVPFSSPPELCVLVLGLGVLLDRGLRGRYAGLLSRGQHTCTALATALLVALAAKVALAVAGSSAGFSGCYWSPLAPGQRCAISYSNPLSLSSATRIDRKIDFGPTEQNAAVASAPAGSTRLGREDLSGSNWDLVFVNDVRFNFYRPGQPDRERLPIGARWSGTVDHQGAAALTFIYAGGSRSASIGVQS